MFDSPDVQNVSELTKADQYNDRSVRLTLNEKSIDELKKIMTKDPSSEKAFELLSRLRFTAKLTDLQEQMTKESVF